jgi:hypothetical protein
LSADTAGASTCATLGVTADTTLLELDVDPDAAKVLAQHADLRRIPLAANVAAFVDAPVLDARLNELNLFTTDRQLGALQTAVDASAAVARSASPTFR